MTLPYRRAQPKSVWVKASRLHPLIPRETDKFKAYYHQRGAVERKFGRLKHEWGLLPLRVRRIARVRCTLTCPSWHILQARYLRYRSPGSVGKFRQ